MRRAARAATTANAAVSTGRGTPDARRAASTAGPAPAAANSSPAVQRTRPSRAWPYSAHAAVTATTTRLAVAASTGAKPSR
ncbi:hypothetical protein BG846_03328 [Streptomyces fradiae ATCC 10745 = DSM 40063]|uniref:Uncharacterized protein n=1 Tax=Streptomyces fradiae ATCC 10745 = DSM 40063 TaxID=1319510 RepID=A0A1Y2NUX8_STRFR|nr:hypothetical protein BG846_03328 [Streptomyces fradiae ATCC 10745 = DSM 40063]